jgi:hypothetical protein
MAVLPTDYTDSVTPTGATTELPATTTRGVNAITTQINTNTTNIAAKTTGMVLHVEAATIGSETYTIASGSVTQIAGTSVDSFSLSVGHRILVWMAPAASGPGSAFTPTSNPANGIYTVTNATTNLTVTRAADFSGTVDPAKMLVMVGNGGAYAGSLFHVTSPASTGTFTYGTTGMTWAVLLGSQPTFDSIWITGPGGATLLDGNTVSGNPTATLPATTTTIVGRDTTDTLTNKSISYNQITGLTVGNTSQQSQVVVSGTSYYVAGSALTVPTNVAVGSRFRWTVAMAKTAAGTGAFAVEIRRGTAGTVADTADVSQSIGTQTAAVDNMMVDVEVVVTTTGATGAYFWSIIPTNKAITATGFGVATGPTGQFSGTVSSVAMNTASLKFGLSFKATTGTPTITVPLVRANGYV